MTTNLKQIEVQKSQKDQRHEQAQAWYKEVEANRQQIIDNAIKTGTVIQKEALFEPEQMYITIAKRLNNERDRLTAFAMLDGLVQKEMGAYHISLINQYVYQNTADAKLLCVLVYKKLEAIIKTLPNCSPFAMSFLEQWFAHEPKEPSTPKQDSIPSELSTPEAMKIIQRAIDAGLIESASDGLKWNGIGKGGVTQLAYFCKRVWLPNNVERLPETAINKLFGVKRIGTYVTKLMDVKNPQKWRSVIDRLFEE